MAWQYVFSLVRISIKSLWRDSTCFPLSESALNGLFAHNCIGVLYFFFNFLVYNLSTEVLCNNYKLSTACCLDGLLDSYWLIYLSIYFFIIYVFIYLFIYFIDLISVCIYLSNQLSGEWFIWLLFAYVCVYFVCLFTIYIHVLFHHLCLGFGLFWYGRFVQSNVDTLISEITSLMYGVCFLTFAFNNLCDYLWIYSSVPFFFFLFFFFLHIYTCFLNECLEDLNTLVFSLLPVQQLHIMQINMKKTTPLLWMR